MSKRFLIIMAALVVVFFGVIIFSKNKQDVSAPGDSAGGSNHIKGEGTNGVSVVEYADFQCPTCGSFYTLVKALEKKYDKQITFQFRHFPLVQLHDNAMIAHRSAEAAGKQDKFWEMHDILYERQKIWSESSNAKLIMEDYASELGLNVDQFKTDFASSEVNDIITADTKLGQDIGVSGTPTFVIDGKKLDDLPRDIDSFSKLIDQAIADKQAN
jgi:protein-disulfide isomerase